MFFLVHLTPGNPFDGDRALSPEALKSLLAQYRLDLPLWQQYLLYLKDLLHGDFGISMKYLGQSINSLLFPDNMGGFWVTLRLSIYTMIIVVPVGIICGAYAGLYKNSWLDKWVVSSSIILTAIPTYRYRPIIGINFGSDFTIVSSRRLGRRRFPTFVFAGVGVSSGLYSHIAFVTRGSMIDVLNSNYIRTARAKGLPTHKILFKHAIRPTLLPVVSLLGPMFAGILVGAVVTEQVLRCLGWVY